MELFFIFLFFSMLFIIASVVSVVNAVLSALPTLFSAVIMFALVVLVLGAFVWIAKTLFSPFEQHFLKYQETAIKIWKGIFYLFFFPVIALMVLVAYLFPFVLLAGVTDNPVLGIVTFALVTALFIFLVMKTKKQETHHLNKPLWSNGSLYIKVLNGVSLVVFTFLFVYVAEWHGLVAFVVSCLVTLLLDAILYKYMPQWFV